MPRYFKKGDVRSNAGGFDKPADFYTVVQTQSSTGANERTKTFAWSGFVNVAPYQGMELRDALREIGETWSTISIQYMPSRLPVEGMWLKLKWTGDWYEIRGVSGDASAYGKVELTCRKLQ
jgi:hypothetical protein